jgi:hypothetical protein
MSERTEYNPGEFCWVDLAVPGMGTTQSEQQPASAPGVRGPSVRGRRYQREVTTFLRV